MLCVVDAHTISGADLLPGFNAMTYAENGFQKAVWSIYAKKICPASKWPYIIAIAML